MEANFEIIVWDRKMTQLMKAWDVFESWKVMWEIKSVSLSYKKSVDFKYVKKIMPTLVEAFEKQNQIVSFLHLVNLSDKNTIIMNEKIKPYINPDVQTVSDGKTWFVLSTYIKNKYEDSELLEK